MKLGTKAQLTDAALEAAMLHLNEGDERDVDVLRAALDKALEHDGLILVRELRQLETEAS